MVNTVTNLLIMLKNLQQMRLKLLQKTAEATNDLIGNKITNKITKALKNSQENNSETVTSKQDTEIPKERYISSGERKEVIDELILMI